MKNSYLLDDQRIKTILPGFLSTLEQHMLILEQCRTEGKLKDLGTAGHTLKGALLNLGLFELAEVAYEIEKQGKQEAEDADYPAMIRHLKENILLITGT
jgi:HPt (histidine-containing phosphotransfer) domain-containing protein